MGKRERIKQDNHAQAATSLEDRLNDISIGSAKELKATLTFHQDDIAQYRLNLQRFRRWLIELESSTQETLGNDVLLEYLSSSQTAIDGDQIEALPDIIQAWRYAVQVHDDGLMPAIPGVLAVLLRVISSSLRFNEAGNNLCRTITRKENATLLQKSMNSPRTRDSTIARCLDLLTQIITFDGGACARNVWLSRSVMLEKLPQFLGMSRKTIHDASEPTSVRDHAIPFFLANLRYQSREAKVDILANHKNVQVVLKDILAEKPSIIVKTLTTFSTYVVEDSGLKKSDKGHLLSDSNLGHFLNILRHESDLAEWKEIHERVEAFLLVSCSSKGQGIVYKQNAWYPSGTEGLLIQEDDFHNHSASSLEDLEKYRDRVPVRNTTLAAFSHDLKPWASLSERKLILRMFEAAPELLADYFLRKKAFSFEPKLTATWVGWATFIYSAVSLPLPIFEMYLEGRIRAPPPVAVVLQNLLPQSLTQQALTRGIKHSKKLIILLTTRILIASFEKLERLLLIWEADSAPEAWQKAAQVVIRQFQARCPDYKQILTAYQACADDQQNLREALSLLLAHYNEVVPQLCLQHRFNVSASITRILKKLTDRSETLLLMELEHLSDVGGSMLDGKWWQKCEGTTLSAITMMVKTAAETGLRSSKNFTGLIKEILQQSYILSSDEDADCMGPLLDSLDSFSTDEHLQEIYDFLDNCMLRIKRKPIKYWYDRDDLPHDSTKAIVSPIFMALLEQWPFFVKSHSTEGNLEYARWICKYMAKSVDAGTSYKQLHALLEQFSKTNQGDELDEVFTDAKRDLESSLRMFEASKLDRVKPVPSNDRIVLREQILQMQQVLDQKLTLKKESEDHPELTKWSTKDVSEAILDSDIGRLIGCLGSQYPEVRLQAIPTLHKFLQRLQHSSHEDRTSVHLLIGELLETVKHNSSEPVPSVAISFASTAPLALSSPLNLMYTKINHFLGRAPDWNLAKLPSYWIDRILYKPPTHKDGHWKEVEWLLDLLVDGLRTEADVNLYRRTDVFDRILVKCTSTFAPRICYEKTLDMLYRCALIGGSTTLITRFGVLATLRTFRILNPKDEILLSAVEDKIRETCDADKVFEWSNGVILCGSRREDKEVRDSYQFGRRDLIVRPRHADVPMVNGNSLH